ncbi:MAG: hypothetical protein GY826_08930, partial [Fuerstiella sp.]|nr:hypothetical protein [Fuerstiella sp.]
MGVTLAEEKSMKYVWSCFVGLMVVFLVQPLAAEEIKVFILAGQSNMVGHANYITIPRLFADDRPEVRKLAALVFKEGQTVTRRTVDEQIATRIERDGINNALRRKEIAGGQALGRAREQVSGLEQQCDEQTSAIRATFAVSDRVYVSSVADRNHSSGPLTV